MCFIFYSVQELVNSLEKKIVQELPTNVTNYELINKLTSENKHIKVQIKHQVFEIYALF